MKTLYSSLIFIALLVFTPIRNNKLPELKQEAISYKQSYSEDLINKKIDTLENMKQEIIKLQIQKGIRTN